MTGHTKNTSTGANSAHPSKLNQDFNLENEFAEYIPKLSEQGLKRFKLASELGQDRLNKEISDQKSHRSYRVMREENRLLTKYITDPTPRPQNIDKSQDLKIMKEQALQTVAQNERRYLENARYDLRADLQNVINKDLREQQQATKQISQSFNAHEQER